MGRDETHTAYLTNKGLATSILEESCKSKTFLGNLGIMRHGYFTGQATPMAKEYNKSALLY